MIRGGGEDGGGGSDGRRPPRTHRSERADSLQMVKSAMVDPVMPVREMVRQGPFYVRK